MFGYIVMNKPETSLKILICTDPFTVDCAENSKVKYGISGQISLTYDMTFVVILLSALHEPHTQREAQDVSFIRSVNSRSEEIQ